MNAKHFIAVWLVIAVPANAADFCVGPSSTGNGSGSDWNNIAQWSTLSPSRGNTYYLKEGSYGTKTFNTALSGTQLITIKKATAAEHGPSDGWSDSLGDEQTVISSRVTFQTGYWTLDGAYRNENDWWDESAYGIMVTRSSVGNTIEAYKNGPATAVSSVTFRYIATITPFYDGSGVSHNFFMQNDSGDAVIGSNLHITHCLMRGGNQHIIPRHINNNIIEYCASERIGGDPHHGENINLYYGPNTDNTTIRYNKFRDSFNIDGYGGTAIIAIRWSSGHKIYGNTFIRCYSSDAIIGFAGSENGENVEVYNNTFVDCMEKPGIALNTSGAAGNVVRNNLWINNSGTLSIQAGTVSDNTTSGSTSIFVDYANEDLRLASNTAAGFTLSSPFDTDALGNPRGVGGEDWSRGAYQFGDFSEPEPEPPALESGVWLIDTVIAR